MRSIEGRKFWSNKTTGTFIVPSPPFGIPRLPTSTDVFQPLRRPIEFPPPSTEIYSCPPVLLSVLLSEVAGKMQGVGCFPGLGKKKKSRTMKVNHSCQWRAPFSPIPLSTELTSRLIRGGILWPHYSSIAPKALRVTF